MRGPRDDGTTASSIALSSDGVPIRYEVRGAGMPALVLVHGWACDRSNWAGQLGALSQRHAVVTLDLGGHGDSGRNRRDWSIDSFGADVAAVVDALHPDAVVLIGHSMGGDVILRAARRLPGRVAALVMADTYKQIGSARSDAEIEEFLDRFRPDFAAATERFVRGMFGEAADATLVDRVARDMAASPPEIALGALRSSLRHAREVPGLLAELALPVTAINPDNAPTDVASLAAHGVRLVVMENVGHFVMMEDAERFNRLLLATLEAVP